MTVTVQPSKSTAHAPRITNRDPVSLRAFAERTGLSVQLLQKYCKQGRILGARKHHLTKHWWIYPPARIVPSPAHL